MVKMNGIIGTFLCLVWLVEGSSVLRTSREATHLSSGVTAGLTKANVIDANFTVRTYYETALEVQWEVYAGERVQYCFVKINHGSSSETRDCLHTNQKINENLQVTSTNLHTSLEDNDLWYKGDFDETENFVDQFENKKENTTMVLYDITGLDACTSYDLELTIIPLGFDPNGYYYEGSLKSEYTLPDETLPPQQLSCNISQDVWTLSWKNPMDDLQCKPLEFSVAWTAESLWNSESDNSSTTAKETKIEFYDYLAYADYSFTVSAVYNNATSEDAYIDCTSPEREPGAPENVTVTENDQSPFLVEWDAPVAANGIITNYIVIINNNSSENISVEVNAPDTFYEATGLETCVSYSVEVVAVNGAGNGPPSDVVTHLIEIGESSNLSLVCNVSSSGIYTQWTPIYRDCEEYSYKVQYDIVIPWKNENWSNETSVTENYFDLPETDFLPGTVYHFIVATEDQNITDECHVNSSDTKSSAPAITRISTTASSVFVEWTPPEEANGLIQSYTILITGDNNQTLQKSADGSLTQVNITENIFACTGYEVEVAAVNGAGEGEFSTPESLSTLEPEEAYIIQYDLFIPWKNENRKNETLVEENSFDLPSQDFFHGTSYHFFVKTENLDFSAECWVDSSDAKSSAPEIVELYATIFLVFVEWTPPEEANGLIQSYTISLTGDNNQTLQESADGSKTQVNITENIFACTSYEVEVAAVNGAGEGNFSASQTVTTPTKVVTNGKCEADSSTQVTVFWEYSEECAEAEYLLTWDGTYLGGSVTTFHDSKYVTASDGSSQLKDLQPYTEYLVCFTNSSDYLVPQCFSCATFAAAPTEPQNFKVFEISSNSMRLSWGPPAYWNGPDSVYSLSVNTKVYDDVSEEYVLVEGMKSDTLYDFSVKALQGVQLSAEATSTCMNARNPELTVKCTAKDTNIIIDWNAIYSNDCVESIY
ncbi:phosphatidylinositol phosphatase PTPRQ [Hyalella azteca]|uniref:Phosphatidylinositol phosphatase PTPRQ n=1 Tax=Hyalella azteca TaxID=294128 RepID=A0A8B7PPQ2_HYAAZ|nr:phosphatidylinositol phosphatase PTPRQ [Hyalella azteca]